MVELSQMENTFFLEKQIETFLRAKLPRNIFEILLNFFRYFPKAQNDFSNILQHNKNVSETSKIVFGKIFFEKKSSNVQMFKLPEELQESEK